MNNAALLGLSALMSLMASIIAASLLVWPRLRQMERNEALVPLVAPHMFLRFIGLSFLVRGVVSPALSKNFAEQAAYGDLIAGVLAMVATIMLIKKVTGATAIVWIFNLW